MRVARLSILAFAAFTVASPLEVEKRASSQQLATFDDLTSVPSLSQINPVGTYRGLNYKSFNNLQAGVTGLLAAGFRPQSSPDVAATSIVESVLIGDRALVAAKGTVSFDLLSLSIGCVVNSAASVAGVPQQCTIAFTAYKAGRKEPYHTVNVQFNPANPVPIQMTQASFPQAFTG